ncbi:hypothetical protein BJX63DRAFT_420924 [Aspergillus granulosus]|uniref:Zn(2)-C6 fungal-type domain-containing protein n=1 Tax=Aspergillus granulosus TaxID=176169 RepID=A0ABR4HF69_9EURO
MFRSRVRKEVSHVKCSRIPLSCESCRARKLKCNREKPCQNCTVRGEQATCTFKGAKNGALISYSKRDADPMRQRIEHLEKIVKGLIAQRESPLEAAPNQESSEPRFESVGRLNSGRAGLKVSDGAQSVNELKRFWNEAQEESEDEQYRLSDTVDGTSLLFSQLQLADIAEILSSLPPKPGIDKLLQLPTFLREYAEHWEDPSQSSIIWIGLLFSILGITILAFQFGEPPHYQGLSESRFDLYRLRTAQYLLRGDIAKCLPYTVETLLRVAINMGYHRHPTHTPSLSILKAEYRRRVWSSVTNMDEVASFITGFPRMIPTINADTKEPCNLHDWELTESTTILPQSMPLSETTPAAYLIVKSRLFRGLGNVVDLNSRPQSGSYTSVLDVDKYLQEAYLNLPLQMRVDPTKADRSWFTKPSDYSSLQLMFMYYHGIITLHRPQIPRNGSDPPGNISRSRCTHAALALLEYQHLLLPQWYRFSQTRQISRSRAAMVLLLELESSPPDVLMDALDWSIAFWNESKKLL